MTPCWQWIRGKLKSGYGCARYNKKNWRAHRLYYELLVGPIPDGLTIDHLCRNRSCVNPGHMEVVTQGVNTLRGFSPSAIHARKTHCPKGHPFDEANTYVNPGRYFRGCRICRKEAVRAFNERKRIAKGVAPCQ